MKTSTTLLAAWCVLIALLIGAIVFFTMKSQSPDSERKTEPPVVHQPPKSTPRPPAQKPPRRGDSTDHTSRPKPTQIEGTVRTRAGGELVAGARVSLFAPSTEAHGRPSSSPDMEEIRLLNQIVSIPVEDWDVPRPFKLWTRNEEATGGSDAELVGDDTDAEGKFSISVGGRVGPGPFVLVAKKEGVGMHVMNEVRPDGEKLNLTLAPAASVTGTVLTEVDSVPVASARVVFDNDKSRFSATTDESGKFVVDGVAPGQYTVAVTAKGRTPLFDQHFRVEANDLNPMVLRMPRGSTLRVHAVLLKPDAPVGRPGAGPDGDPVADAQIVAFHMDMSAYVMGKTNAQGFVEFPGMPAGEYTINGLAKGVVSETEVSMTVDKNQLVQEETIEFTPAVETTIEVVDEAGRPLAGVEFFGVNNEDRYDVLRSGRLGVTDTEGKIKCVFEAMGPRSAAFGFKAGFAVVHAIPEMTDEESPAPLRLVAKKPINVHGVVRASDGKPIPDAIVAVNVTNMDPESTDVDMDLEVRADSQGRYSLPFLPRVEGITLTASTPDNSAIMDADVELEEGKSDYAIDISMELDDASDAAAGKK